MQIQTTRAFRPILRRVSSAWRFGLLLSLSAAGMATAADDPWTVRVRLASFKYMPDLTHAVAVGVEAPEPGKEEPLRLSNRSFSAAQSVRIDGVLRLYPEGVQNYGATAPLCELQLPKDVSSWLIILFGDGKQNQQYRMIPIVDRDFLMGSFHFLNASAYPIGGSIDDDIFQVLPGQQFNYPNPSGSSDRIRISVNFAYSEEDEWKRLSSSRWTFNPEVRTLMICFWDPTYDRLRFFGITDSAPPEDPSAPPPLG